MLNPGACRPKLEGLSPSEQPDFTLALRKLLFGRPQVLGAARAKSLFFSGTGHYSESEWLVFAGGFGGTVTTTKSAKNEPSSNVALSGPAALSDYSAGKVKAPKIEWKRNVKPHEQSAAEGEKKEKQWTAVTDETILHVKKLYASGSSFSQITKQLSVAPSTIKGIVMGGTQKYAQTGPRSPGMKNLLNVSESQWEGVRKMGAAQLATHGKVDFEEVGAAYGMKNWRAKAIFFAKKQYKA